MEHEAWSMERGTKNAERGTSNLERGTWNAQRGTRNSEHGTWNAECQSENFFRSRSRTLPQRSAGDHVKIALEPIGFGLLCK